MFAKGIFRFMAGYLCPGCQVRKSAPKVLDSASETLALRSEADPVAMDPRRERVSWTLGDFMGPLRQWTPNSAGSRRIIEVDLDALLSGALSEILAQKSWYLGFLVETSITRRAQRFHRGSE